MFSEQDIDIVEPIARELGISPTTLLAVAEFTSTGKIYSKVKGEPVITFHGRRFETFLKGDALMDARSDGLLDTSLGNLKPRLPQIRQWRLLDRAILINRIAALASTSWGVGQVLGAHWQWLGYGSADALVAEVRSGLHGQMTLLARYIQKANLVDSLQKQDWQTFVRLYHFEDCSVKRDYKRLAKAHAKWSNRLTSKELPKAYSQNDPVHEDRLMFGMSGSKVRAMQCALSRKGYILVDDGFFGLVTDRVVRQFQRDHLIDETGILGEAERSILQGRFTCLWERLKFHQFQIRQCMRVIFDHVQEQWRQKKVSFKRAL